VSSTRRQSAREALESADQAAGLLRADPRVRLVYVFGSAASADAGTVRDVDLAVLTEPALSLDELMRLRARLVSGTGASMDLVSLNDASIVLAHEVVESGRCLYTSSPDVETDFVIRTRARYWDFKPYRDEQWRLAGERLERRRASQA
jgi:predicted nucleotidyltransferase